MVRSLTAGAALLVLAGCSSDGRECSVVSLEQTGSFCPPDIVVDRSDLYCYRTLAGVDCHTFPDPYANGSRTLESPPPNRVVR